MADFDLESLLRPVSEAEPCGKDLEYAPEFLELQELARGKPAQEIGDRVRAAQEPPWPKVREAAASLLGATKDLRVAGIFHQALLKTEGLNGLANGLSLMAGLLDRYWNRVYPLLDADDDNDPTFRVNALVVAIAGDEVLAAVRLAPLVESRQFGRHGLRSYRIASGTLKVESVGGQEIDLAQELARIESAMGEASLETLQTAAAAANSAANSVNSIQKLLLDKADGIPAELTELASDVKDIRSFLEAQLTRRGADTGGGADSSQSDGASTQTGGSGMSGEVRSRADVTRALDRICEYYRRAEPSSPVPLLLERAKRLVDKDFMSIIRDLTPGGVTEAEVIGGLEKKDS